MADEFVLDGLDHLAHGSRAAQRLMLATASLASTGSPSWNFSPGRSRNVQMRPSGDTSSASTIWRCGCELAVDAVKHVPHQQPGIAGDVGGAPDRIEIGEIGMRHEAQRARRGALRDRRGGKAAGRQRRPHRPRSSRMFVDP